MNGHGLAAPTAASERHKEQAIVALGNLVGRQALIMGFSDAFAIVGFVLVLAAISVALTKKS